MVSIIVLIILAGVSIAMLVGENGIITQAQRAAQETEIKGDEEKIRLAMAAAQIANNGNTALKDDIEIALLENGTKSIVVDKEDGTRNIIFLDSKKIYKLNSDGSIEDTNSDFDSIYVAPDSQDDPRNEGVIGIGTDGQPVDMDLWEYTLLEDGTYGLNDEETITAVQEENWSMATIGYLGTFTENGEIDGVIPQYIKGKTDSIFIPVTDLTYLFARSENMKVMPEIPNTVTNMNNTFLRCINLMSLSKIPARVTNMESTFANCILINNAPEIPNTVENMTGTFRNCSNLVSVSIIPNSVTNMQETFLNCSKLSGIITINANLTGAVLSNGQKDYYSMFWNAATEVGCEVKVTGTCPILEEYVTRLNRDNITLLD